MLANEMLLQLIEYIEQNLFNDISLDIICNDLNYSKYYLSRVFNSAAGMSINQYINKRRLSESALSLKEKKTVYDVAFNSCFNSSEYYISLFKKEFGITPKQYQNNNVYICITKKLIFERNNTMEFKDVKETNDYLIKNAKNKSELTNTFLKIKDAVLIKQEGAEIEYAIILKEEDIYRVEVVSLDLIIGNSISHKIYTSTTSDILIKNISIIEDEVTLEFENKLTKEIVKAKLVANESKIKSRFNIEREDR